MKIDVTRRTKRERERTIEKVKRPVINFTNILRAAFALKFILPKNYKDRPVST